MNTCRFSSALTRVLCALLLSGAYFDAHGNTLMQDKGIYLAGPFPTPDISQPAGSSAEAVFVAGSVANAPLFLNELVVAGEGSHGVFSNNGWADGSAFQVNVTSEASGAWISWDLAGTSYSLTYVSVNFDNNFYHVYGTNPLAKSEGAIFVTGNLRDAISHIHFFGISNVPESGASAAMLLLGLIGLASFRCYLRT